MGLPSPRKSKKLSRWFSRLPPAVFPQEKGFYALNLQTQNSEIRVNEDARRQIMTIRLINSSSTSVSNVCGYLWIMDYP